MKLGKVLGLLATLLLVTLLSLWLADSFNKVEPLAQNEAEPKLDGHERMLALLKEIRDQARQSDPLTGQAQLDMAKTMLANLTADSPVSDQINIRARLGDIQLMAGDTVQAAKNLAEAYELLAPLRDRVAPEVLQHALLDVAVAHLRMGEVDNCINCSTCDSCILPIRAQGVHKKPLGSRKSVQYLDRLLELNPQDLTGRWLLNIAHMTLGDYPNAVPPQFLIPPAKFESSFEFPRFVNDAKTAGLANFSLSGGVIADDFNGDQWLDIVTSDWGAGGQLKYYRNTGNGKFVDETKEAGFLGLYGGLNAIQADYDNDGDMDVLVLRGAWRAGRHPNSLLRNDGKGHFRDVTFESGLGEEHFPTQTASWADYDNDGDLDLYIGNESFPCQLFQNDGHGKFADVAVAAGVTNDEFTKGVIWGDYNGDRYPDLYVSNYGKPELPISSRGSRSGSWFNAPKGTPNRLYRNNRDGTFTDVANELQVSLPLLSFPTWFWDVNNDGILDIYVASYAGQTIGVASEFFDVPLETERNRLYLGNKEGGFTEVSQQFGMTRVSSTMGANFGDLDNDGFDDVYLGTGAPEFEALVPNIMYQNQAGQGFRDVSAAGGFGHLQKGHAVCFADLDNDGDQDVYCVLGGAYAGDAFANALFVNPGFGNHWLKVTLRGTQSNRSGIGARLHVRIDEDGQSRDIYKWVNSGGSFGANPLRKEIGLGKASKIELLEVYWPTSDRTQTYREIPLDSWIELNEQDNSVKVK